MAHTTQAGRIELGGSTRELSSVLENNTRLAILDAGPLVTAPGVSGSVVYTSSGWLFECRAEIVPSGDTLLWFPANTPEYPTENSHYHGKMQKVNHLYQLRSTDGGTSWNEARPAFHIDYNQHGAIPLAPGRPDGYAAGRSGASNSGDAPTWSSGGSGSVRASGGNSDAISGSSDAHSGDPRPAPATPHRPGRVFMFGTQPLWVAFGRGSRENAPIGYRYSDDDCEHWSEVHVIRPVNDPEFRGMSVMRMTETAKGTWLLGSHEGDWSYKPLITCQYILRSDDQGRTWEVVPGARHGGWRLTSHGRMDEGRPIALADGRVLLMFRTPEGHLWQSWSEDDGRSWTDPAPSTLVHPDAPPMLFTLSDGKTLVAFHHNRFHDTNYTGLGGGKLEIMQDRAEIWFSTSANGGETWSEPRFLFTNAAQPDLDTPFRNYQCSYIDAVVRDGVINLFVPHRWQQVLHLRVAENELESMPTREELDLR
jgi:hypothetical protein